MINTITKSSSSTLNSATLNSYQKTKPSSPSTTTKPLDVSPLIHQSHAAENINEMKKSTSMHIADSKKSSPKKTKTPCYHDE